MYFKINSNTFLAFLSAYSVLYYSEISVMVPIHLVIFPYSSLTGNTLDKNHLNSPSFPRNKKVSSKGSPVKGDTLNFSITDSTKSE